MKNLNKIALGVLISIISVGLSAFTTKPKLTGNWYALKMSIGNIPPSDSRAQLFTNYEISSQQPNEPDDCKGSIYVCAAEFANGTQVAPTNIQLKD